ncbi:hypothetical protein [Sphaerospermopsis sp. LEGE 08334]|jgi:hypothetical protein|uniref:hypothetical protein n=1 Tax=Sphaerospermopsis sp. LEGE 08334 TaxID=1828651 RepID=UPI00187EC613|nr:hypothetical protein [Sphaerospermopsis sp. LEGE 08334]MBE9056699.1 hypothetical protein [Sphaerospermopsis sp. LEGE 08334]
MQTKPPLQQIIAGVVILPDGQIAIAFYQILVMLLSHLSTLFNSYKTKEVGK